MMVEFIKSVKYFVKMTVIHRVNVSCFNVSVSNYLQQP